MAELKVIYLVSAEEKGSFFWQVGLTTYNTNSKLLKGCYLECFRQKILEERAAKIIQKAISLNIQNLQRSCRKEGYNLKKAIRGFSYDLPLSVIEQIFDFWIEAYKQPEVWKICFGLLNCRKSFSLTNPFIRKALKGYSYEMNEKIEYLHSYRPVVLKGINELNPPMWQ